MDPRRLPLSFVPKGEWISIEDVARYLRCPVSHVEELLLDPGVALEARGRGPGEEPLVARADLARWIKSRGVTGG